MSEQPNPVSETATPADVQPSVDVVILGAGLAGLSLAQQLLLETDDLHILLLDRQTQIPPTRQKVGEATVQVSGYYFAKVLDLEEHLLREHYMKYNLRFLWQTPGTSGDAYEHYSQSYIRPLSNIASYQLDRNKVEAELLRRNRTDDRYRDAFGVRIGNVSLSENGGLHTVAYSENGTTHEVTSRWVVDATGRGKLLAKRKQLQRKSPIRHASFWFWVDGLVNVETLTDLSPREIRLHPDRAHIGHLPVWLATNHFAGEGFWLWVIPLQGRTSFGLVFDKNRIETDRVSSPEKLVDFLCETFPLLGRTLRDRELIDFAGYKDYAYDCAQTIHPQRWALTGEAGRFSDPLYSPGGDLIAVHNTLITAAMKSTDDEDLANRARAYEQLMRAVYGAYIPGYAQAYDVLGDQEGYALRYGWELTIYFALYVFPFINDLFTDRRFILGFLRVFSQLGAANKGLMQMLSDYVHWKKEMREPITENRFFDFMELASLRHAEQTFYRVGLGVDEAKRVLGRQLDNLRELARFIVTHVASVVLDEPRVLTNKAFVESIDLDAITFDPDDFARRWEMAQSADGDMSYAWQLDPFVLDRFRTAPRTATVPAS